MTKPVGSTSNRANADWRFSKPLMEVDLSVTQELIADLSNHVGKYNGWFIRIVEAGYGGTATGIQYAISCASAATSAFNATQDVAVWGRFNSSSAATAIISGSGTGEIVFAGAAGLLVSTATAPTINAEITITGIKSGSPAFRWLSSYTATSGTGVFGNGGGVFFTTQPCAFIRVSESMATGLGPVFSRGKMQVYGIP